MSAWIYTVSESTIIKILKYIGREGKIRAHPFNFFFYFYFYQESNNVFYRSLWVLFNRIKILQFVCLSIKLCELYFNWREKNISKNQILRKIQPSMR